MGSPKHNGDVLLPTALRSRWQPMRGGLLNIYRYDYQEFRYEDGRLLLRGNNGTGKSRVLALQLPFLLDGEIIPQRVEPDQDPAKRMEWNLLLGGKHDDRLGYTWIEFGRATESGDAEYKTLGCALRAVQGYGIRQQWFFITNLRMGRDLFLVNEVGQPLSKTKLETVIGDKGKVFGTSKVEDDRRDYRDAVDKALFGLGDRYEALLNLLIQLRQPQLSRTLNEDRLSNALSQALPPLPEAVLADVAEAFRSLETDRQELADFRAARDSAELFLKEYQRYIQIAARRRAEEVRQTNSTYEATQRRLRAAENAFNKAKTELGQLQTQIGELSIDEQRAMAAESTLRQSPEMQDARALEDARVTMESGQTLAQRAQNEASEAAAGLAAEEQQQKITEQKASVASKTVQTAATRTLEAAQALGLEHRHKEAVERLGLPEADASKVDAAASSLRDVVKRRLDAARHVANLNAQVESAHQQLAVAQQGFNQVEGQLNDSVEGERQSVANVNGETVALVAAFRRWATSVTEFKVLDSDDLESAFINWCEAPEGDSPMANMLKEAERVASRAIQTARVEVNARLKAANDQLDQFQKEFNRLRDGYHEPPPSPHTRPADVRAHRPGAPLWALCDFVSDVSGSDRANIEAALEASGLLDAWITPEGRLLSQNEHDTVLAVGTSEPAPNDRGLDTVLSPNIDKHDQRATAVSEHTVRAVLRHIGFGGNAGAVWVDKSGRWQLGPLHGMWSKPAAQHIGYASREAERRRRMAELETLIDTAQAAVSGVGKELETLAQREATLKREAKEAPSDGNVRRALAELDAAHRTVTAMRQRLTEAEARLADARKFLNTARGERDQAAADLGITEWVNKLPELTEAVHTYSQALAEFWPTIKTQSEARNQLAMALERVASATRNLDLRSTQLVEAKGKAAAAEEKFKTLQSTVGAAVREVQRKLEQATKRAKEVREKKDAAEQQHSTKKIEEGVAQATIDQTRNELDAKETERSSSVATLVTFIGTRQLSVAHTEFSDVAPGALSVARAVELARRIEAALNTVDHGEEAWNRNQREIHSHFETLQGSLRAHGYMPEASMNDGIFVVSIQFQGRSCTIAELRDNVVTIIQERQQLLDAREREVLENYLIDEVAEHLHDLLHRALKWKDDVNEELAKRPMSTGMMLRFVWDSISELPPTFAEARRLLLGARGTWSPAERAAVGEFLQQQIKAVRAANDTGTWQDHLAEAFDYRKWHRFGVERKQDGVWKRLTRRTHGTGSGGEKAIALTLPQFAAAAAHYKSADKAAPRLILLDEAFVGVDKNMRAKCMELLRVFDLDVVMTSESEWGCYPTVPAIAIYQLSAREGVDAVYATRWVWNGKKRVRDDSPLPDARPPTIDGQATRLMELT
jgi:uncharacterized protein (TIGR02680 family)